MCVLRTGQKNCKKCPTRFSICKDKNTRKKRRI